MKTISIGRDASNNIVLNDKTVSRKHAQLSLIGDGQVLIKDLGSSNGTFINGNKISEQFLHAGDIVKCGSTFLNWSLALKENQNYSHPINQGPEIPSKKNQYSFSSKPINIDEIRHEKEKVYLILSLVFSSLFWLGVVTGLLLLKLPILSFITIGVSVLILIFFIWIDGLFLKATLYGNSVQVNIYQYPEVHKISSEFSMRLGLKSIPDLFICNNNGIVNAIALNILSKNYVLLSSSLVDLMLASKNIDALSMIIGHELGHHASGHTNLWKNLLLAPAFIIPFLGAAYRRACEYSADRIGFVLSGNLIESQNALVALALGSQHLLQTSNIDEFCKQENNVPEFMGFIQKVFSRHPRTTKRIIEITTFGNYNIIV